jgi:hypothetical protein
LSIIWWLLVALVELGAQVTAAAVALVAFDVL